MTDPSSNIGLARRLFRSALSRIETLEQLPIAPPAWIAGFLGIVSVRHLLELRSGSFPLYPGSAFYVHYVLAYLAPLLGLCLVLSLGSGVRLERVLRLMLLAWGLTLVPPLVDTLAARAHEAQIGYMELGETPLTTVFGRFFDPTYALGGTTLGIRVETLIACLLGAIYAAVRAPRRRILRALGTAAGVYVTSLFFFTVPYLFLRSLRLVFPGLSWKILYQAVGVVPRPETWEVRIDQGVLLYLLPLTLALGATALALTKPALLRRIAAAFSGSEALTWMIASALGAYVGWRLLEGIPQKVDPIPFDYLAALAGPVSLLLAGAGAALLARSDRNDGGAEGAAEPASASAEERAGVAVLSGAEASGEPPGAASEAALTGGAGLALLLAAAILSAAASPDFTAFAAIAVGSGFLARGLARYLPWALFAPQAASGIALLAAFIAGYALRAGEEAVTLLPGPLLLLLFAIGFLADLPASPALRSGPWRVVARATCALAPAVCIAVPWVWLAMAVPTSVLIVCLIGSAAALAAAFWTSVRLSAAVAVLGASLVLASLISSPTQTSRWRALALDPPIYFMRLSQKAEDAGNMDAAVGAADEAVRRAPELAPAHHRLGFARYRRGDYSGAIDEFRITAGLRPWDAGVKVNLATALLKAGRGEEALAAAGEAISADPAYASGYFVRAQSLDALGRTAEATQVWKQYLERAAHDMDEAAFVETARQRLGGGAPR